MTLVPASSVFEPHANPLEIDEAPQVHCFGPTGFDIDSTQGHESDWLTFDPVPVTVGHIQDPGRFFVQTENTEKCFNLISNTLYSFPLEPLIETPRFGQNVVLKTERGFFRARKLYRPHRFYLIDTGQEVHGVVMFRMPNLPCLQQYPATIRCHVDDVRPVEDVWNEKAIERFQHWVKEAERRRERMLVQPRGRMKKLMPDGGWSVPVELYFDLKTCDDVVTNFKVVTISLSQRLLRENLAALTWPEWDVEEGEEEEDESWNGDQEISGDFDESLVDEIDFNTVKQWLPPRIPQKTTLLMRPTHLDDLGQVYAQFYDSRHLIREMRTQFSLLYEYDDVDPFTKAKWEIGEICVVRYYKDDRFYRGLITGRSTGQKTMFSVLFVDFGNVEVVSQADLRIPITFGNVPIQNIRLVFADVQISLDSSDLDVIYDKLCYETTYRVQVKILPNQSHLPLQAQFFTWNGSHWEDVQLWCMKRNLAINQQCNWEKNQNAWSQIAFGIDAVLGSCESEGESDLDEETSHNHDSPFSILPIDYNQGLVKCVIVSIFPGLQISIIREEDLKDYDKMQLELQSAADEAPPANPIPGIPVAAMSNDSEQFRRAYILNESKVWFVDYQEMMPVKSCVLKQLPDCFLECPEFGHRLYLSYEFDPEIIDEDALNKVLKKAMRSPPGLESLCFMSDGDSNVGKLKLKRLIGNGEVVQDLFENEIKNKAVF